MERTKLLLKAASAVFTALLVYFAYNYISNLMVDADFESVAVNWPILLLSGFIFIVSYILLSLHWLMCMRLVSSAHLSHALTFFASQPYKYLPTSLFTFSFRAVYSKRLGVGVKKSSIAQLYENVSMVGSSAALAILLVAFSSDATYGMLVLFFYLCTAFIFVFKIKNIKLKFRDRQFDVSFMNLLKVLSVSVMGWSVMGLAFVTLNYALGQSVNVIGFIAANTAAFSLSLLAFFAPGGIGVREFVYSVFSVSATGIIAWRIITFTIDIILGIVAIVIVMSNNRR